MAELAWHQSITSLWMLMQLRESFTLLEKLWNGAGDGRSEGRTESTRRGSVFVVTMRMRSSQPLCTSTQLYVAYKFDASIAAPLTWGRQ